ncbi:hypothetical protein NDU88_010762 [Pleurodeles waltl]|uniref:Uncharacterized protein n=1 Tax=Pleurodeles waltl TaxID=8319 RepID=A0AAV7QVA9_PLEWA|nr:hypothetical protein NDU88_010762 [Pleurodeles waltl]
MSGELSAVERRDEQALRVDRYQRDEDLHKIPGVKCLANRKNLQEMQDRFGVQSGSRRKGALSGTNERQLDAEREYINEEFENNTDDNNLDENVLDLEYKDGLEEELVVILELRMERI